MNDHIGIDYGSTAGSNRDLVTGIHYGVISQHTVGQAWYDGAEPDYGQPTCPKCGSVVKDVSAIEADVSEWLQHRRRGCDDYACEHCEHTLDSQDCFGDEPIGWSFEDAAYRLSDCLDTDIFVSRSPYYTFSAFCSPCVPGAGNLDSPVEGGVKTYCLGHEWFEEDCAPYPVYSVATGKIIEA